MKQLKLLLAAGALMLATGISAQTDVTGTYLTNAGFENCAAFGNGNAAAVASAAGTDYASSGWTLAQFSAWSNSAVFEYGSGQINGSNVPSSDPKGQSGKGLAFSQGWSGTNRYLSDIITLPAGTYTIVAPTNNVLSTATQMKSLLGFVPTSGSSYLSTRNSFPYNTWTIDMVEFTLTEATEGKIQVGFTAISGGSGSNAKPVVDGIIIYDGPYNAELIANKERLESCSFLTPSEDLLVNGSFDEANQGWTLSNMGYQKNGERPTRYVEKWNGSPLTGNGYARQTVSNLPAGAYILKGTVNTNKEENGGTQLKVNDETISVSGTWTEYEIIYNLEADGDVTVSFDYNNLASNWIAIDGFSLVYGGPYDKYMEDKETYGHRLAWQNALDAAQDAIDNVDYENVTGQEYTDLDDLITANETEPTTAQGYDDAAAELKAATAAFIAAAPAYNAYQAVVELVTAAGTLEYASEDAATDLEEANSSSPESAIFATEMAANISTKLRAYYESHALAEGVEGAVDMSDKISAANADTNEGWTNGIGTNQGQGYTDADNNVAPKYLDGGWAANASANIDMTRKVELPAGKYLLTVTARGSVDLTEYKLSIAGQTIELPHIGNTGGVFNNGWNDASIEFESDGTPLTLEIKANSTASQQWISLNRFRLVQLEKIEVPMADAADYAALNAAIAAAEANTLGFDEGEYAPYNNIEALEALAAAKAIDQNVENTKEAIQALTASLNAVWTANTTEVNAIFDGQFATTAANETSGDINLPGWTKVQGIRLLVKDKAIDPGLEYTDGEAAVFSWGGTTLTYGEQTGYTLPLNEGEVYELTFKISGWRDGDLPSVVKVALDGAEQSAPTGSLSSIAPINNGEDNPFVQLKFYLTPTAEEGNSTLTIYANYHFTVADLSLKLATPVEINEAVAYTPENNSKAYVKLTRTIKPGMNTVVLPFELTANDIKTLGGEGAVAYTVSAYANDNLTFETAETVPANTPFFLKAEVGTADREDGKVFTFLDKKVEAGIPEAVTPDGACSLLGSYEATYTVPESDAMQTAYILSGGQFYKVDSPVTIKNTRFYVLVDGEHNANTLGFTFIDGEANAINGIASETAAPEGIYNLQGQKVEEATKGIYIINGKKVLVK